ncbi:MAG: Exoribonuclease, partial [Thermoleophilia bacterium]|nr:Exoribonuclease [Thermoleophilia bacterium]
MSLTCCQLLKHGKYVAAHPWFEPGATIALGNAKQHMEHIGKLVLVQAGARNVGRIVEVLGSVESIHAVMRGLLAEEGLLGPDPAPGFEVGAPAADVAAQLDGLPAEVPFLEQREDRRADLVVTIDPPTAKDHDDAIGLEAADGDDHAWKLWVHIADVSAYVPVGSAIDLEAADRAMSAYVPGTVAPMLPHALSSDLCSLRPGVDRGCVSVCSDIAEDGSIVRVRFARTLIRSARRLTYDQVDQLIQSDVPVDPVIDELLRGLDGVTRLLRDRRMARGALNMALPDVEIELGDEHPEDARLASESRSHQLVEECMLVANDAVGLRLAQAQAPGMWRVHEHPDPQSVVAMLQTFEALGIPTPPVPESFAGAEAAKLAAEAAVRAGRYAETARRGLVTFGPRVLRALMQAEYRAKTGPHSGLATMHYAHFTSPIRRYPDLVNHRSLLQQL